MKAEHTRKVLEEFRRTPAAESFREVEMTLVNFVEAIVEDLEAGDVKQTDHSVDIEQEDVNEAVYPCATSTSDIKPVYSLGSVQMVCACGKPLTDEDKKEIEDEFRKSYSSCFGKCGSTHCNHDQSPT